MSPTVRGVVSTPNANATPKQSFFEMLRQGRAQDKPFNIQDLIAEVDKELGQPTKSLDDVQTPDPTLEQHAKDFRNLEKQIGSVINKSSRKLFNKKMVVFADDGRAAFGLKGEDDADSESKELHSISGASHNPPEPESSSIENLMRLALNRSFSSRATDEQGDQLNLISPRPKDKRSSLTARARKESRQPLANLSVYGGSLVYGLDSKEPNTFARPRLAHVEVYLIIYSKRGQLTYFWCPFSYPSGLRTKKSFHSEIEMNGFQDEEIHFQTDDTSLVIIGYRHAREGLNARKVTEVVELPVGLYPENLRVSRIPNWNLVIQQVNHY